jgi:hypothetical protein
MSIDVLKKGDVALIGILSDGNSSYKKGAARAPEYIRRALHSWSTNLCSELGVDLANNPGFIDVGDREIADGADNFLAIESNIDQIIERGALPLILGGDHAITYPVARLIFCTLMPIRIYMKTSRGILIPMPAPSRALWKRVLPNAWYRLVSAHLISISANRLIVTALSATK